MYLFIKSLHIISFVAWMAGLLYLPRLFVYHSEEKVDSHTYERFCLMEYRLLKFIMNPAMVATWIFGLLLILYDDSLIFSLWFIIKLILVLLLSGFHGFLSVCRKNFSNKNNHRNSRYFRIINEFPTIILIAVVFLVVFKPNF